MKSFFENQKAIFFLIIGLVLVAFGQVLSFQFVNLDDATHIVHNPFVNEPSLRNIWKLWETQFFHLYIPVMYSFWTVIAAISHFITGKSGGAGLSAEVFHSVNLIFHIFNSLFIFYFGKYILEKFYQNQSEINLCAFFGAVLFAIHPLQAEPVSWVSGGKDVWSTFLLLSSLYFYLKAFDLNWIFHKAKSIKKKDSWKRRKSQPKVLQFMIISSVIFLAALLSKPSVVVFPGLILVLNYFLLKKNLKLSFWGLLPFILISLPIAWITKSAQATDTLWYVTPIPLRPVIALDTLWFYLAKIFVPWPLAPDYSRTPQWVLSQSWIYFTAGLPLLLIGISVWKRNSYPLLLAALAFLLCSLFPVLGLVPFLYQDISTVADRYMYLSFLGLSLVTTCLLIEFRHKKFFYFSPLVLLLFLPLSFVQSSKWATSEKLFLHTTHVNTRSWQANYNLAQHYLTIGNMATGKAHLERCIQLNPKYLKAKVALGAVFIMEKKYKRAIEYFEQLIAIEKPSPDKHLAEHSDLYMKYATAVEASGQRPRSLELYKMATQINWSNGDAQYNYARALFVEGQYKLAMKHIKKALRLVPARKDFAKLYNAIRQKM